MRHGTSILGAALAAASLSACGLVPLPGASRGGSTGGASGGDTATTALTPGSSTYVDPGPHYGPIAAKRAGQVVFSSAPIAMDSADDSAVYATYKLGEPLYIRYWAAESAHNLMPNCSEPRTVLRAEVNGEYAGKAPSYWGSFGGYDVGDTKTRGASSLSNELDLAFTSPSLWSAEREIAGEAAVREFNAQVIPKLHEGSNELRVVVTMMCSGADESDPIVGDGTLKVEVAPGGGAAYLQKFGTTIGKSPHPENKKLVPQIIKAMQAKSDWDNEEFLGASVVSDDWEPVRNEYTGVLTELRVTAALVVRQKKETSKEACRLFTMGFGKDPAGGSLYYVWTGDSTPFPCSNAPK
jgi:hypothetical protein